jgi:CheY-like chemotaxis protein
MLHILVAEDNVLNRKVLLRMLSGLECVVSAVENGRQVLEAVQAQHFDLVLMDVRMPDLDGITTTRQVHATAASSRLASHLCGDGWRVGRRKARVPRRRDAGFLDDRCAP